MKLIILSTLLTVCLSEPPVPNYLPTNHQAPQRPSTSYLPSSQGGTGHAPGLSQVPASNYLPSNHETHPQSSGNLSSNYLPPNQNQVPSSNYLPPNQGSQSAHSQSSGNPGASYLPPNQGYPSGPDGNGNRRPQQEVEKNAAVLRQDQEINEHGYHYAYETSNGIRAEEAGDAWQSQGGFSYKGDDGITYTVTYTAGENGGFQPRGDHLPVAPPVPDDILAALKKNEQDEANGIFDDGKYRPDEHGGLGVNNHQGSNSGYQY